MSGPIALDQKWCHAGGICSHGKETKNYVGVFASWINWDVWIIFPENICYYRMDGSAQEEKKGIGGKIMGHGL